MFLKKNDETFHYELHVSLMFKLLFLSCESVANIPLIVKRMHYENK